MPQTLLAIGIRPLEVSDLDEIMTIEPAAYGTHHWSSQSFVNELTNPQGSYFGAINLKDGTLVGYSGFWLIDDEAHITTLAVHPEYRRQKIGERLLINNFIESRKLAANWMTLEVRITNEAAQKLYFKYGFRKLGVRRKYYQDNSEDALVLWTDRLSDAGFIESFISKMKGFDLSTRGMKELFLFGAEADEYVQLAWAEESIMTARATA